MNWKDIERSEENLETLSEIMQKEVIGMDANTIDMMSMHFMLMKVSLVGLRGYAGDTVMDDIIGEKPIVVAQTLHDLGEVIGRQGSPEGLTHMFEKSYSVVVNVLTTLGKMPSMIPEA